MRICLASNLYPPDVIGGAETIVGHIARALRAADCEVTVITTAPRGRAGSEAADGIRVLRIAGDNLYWAGDARRQPQALKPLWHAIDLWNPSVYRRVHRLLARDNFDVIHTHNLGGLSPAVWSAAAAAGTPIVHTPHDYALTCVRSTRMTPRGRTCWTPCTACALRGRWLRRLSRLVDGVAAPSQFVIDRHRELGFFPNASFAVVPWGVPRSMVPAPARRDGPDVRFLYLGNLAPHKGVRVLLEAFARTKAASARLEIAGAGALAAACTAAAADRRITFHGFVRGPEKDALLGSCHALVFPSICWETAGLVLLEAYNSELPVVAARTGGIPEFVDDGITGFLVEPGDAASLAQRLETLAADPGLIRRMGAHCRARAERFTIERTVAGLLRVYESAVRR